VLRFLETVAIGLFSGVLSGAFGIGGGVVTTPAIRLLLGAPALVAVGTPLPVILPSALTGAINYARNGVADVRSGLIAGFAGAALSVVGAWLTTIAGGTVVLLATAALILYTAADMILQTVRPPASQRDVPPEGERDTVRTDPPVWQLVLIGAVTGLYSGFLGLGGGFVLVPMLTRWLGFPIKRAIATSLVTIAVLAVPGSVTHWFLGNIDPVIALALMIGVVPGAIIGSRFTLGSADRTVRIGFAVMLLMVGAVLAATELISVLR